MHGPSLGRRTTVWALVLDISIATFNVHAGVDGWGRPFPLQDELLALDSDIVLLQESWRPAGGESAASLTARRMGACVVAELPLAYGHLLGPSEGAPPKWGPPPLPESRGRALWLRPAPDLRLHVDGEPTDAPVYTPGDGPPAPTSRGSGLRRARSTEKTMPRSAITRGPEAGSWGLAVLSKLPLVEWRIVDLGRLPRDPVRRAALVCTLAREDVQLEVVVTHLSHLTRGSLGQASLLRERLSPPDRPAVLGGDMNAWGPVVLRMFPGWRRLVRGRSWPAWRPHSQVDHLLGTPTLAVVEGEVLDDAGSDHRPIRARLSLV